MSSWKAVLKSDGPLCKEAIAARRFALENRGFRQVRMHDPAFSALRSLLARSESIVRFGSGKSLTWAVSNEKNTQYTIGTLDHHGHWKAGGWAAEHLVCLTAGTPMPTLRDACPILKPRVRRIILHRGSLCHFCDRPMPMGDITVEHWLARSLGGDSSYDNLRLAHQRCNEMAGSLSIKEKNRLRYQLKAAGQPRAASLHHSTSECRFRLLTDGVGPCTSSTTSS